MSARQPPGGMPGHEIPSHERNVERSAHRLILGALQELGKAPHEGGEVLPDTDLAGTMLNTLGDFWDRALESIKSPNECRAPRQGLTPSGGLQKIPYDHEDLMGIFVVRVWIVATEVGEIFGQLVGLTHHDLDFVVSMRSAEPSRPHA